MAHSLRQDVLNALLVVLVGVPAVLLADHVFSDECTQGAGLRGPLLGPGLWPPAGPAAETPGEAVCRLGLHHPLLFVNAVFFANVCVLFWIISLIQGSTWLIDPYWTIIPPMIALFFGLHPLRSGLPARINLATGLTFVWAVRLTHSYFRREKWHFGEREDWRFAEMRLRYGPSWWWRSLLLAFVSQQPMLVGLCLPLWAVSFHGGGEALTGLDVALALACLAGVRVADAADTQLHQYMTSKAGAARRGERPSKLLLAGLWRYSRHPNYFGEQLWWFSLGGLAAVVGQPWCLVGALFNMGVMWQVTGMTEERMLRDPSRREIYEWYVANVPSWLPLPPALVGELTVPKHFQHLVCR